jgi:hypothetical protein
VRAAFYSSDLAWPLTRITVDVAYSHTGGSAPALVRQPGA